MTSVSILRLGLDILEGFGSLETGVGFGSLLDRFVLASGVPAKRVLHCGRRKDYDGALSLTAGGRAANGWLE